VKRSPMTRSTPLRRTDGKARADVPFKFKRCAKTRGGCGLAFPAVRPMQAACSPLCAQRMAELKRQKAERKADAEKRDRLKPRAQWLNEAQWAFNKYIRLRDAKEPCVSCLRHHTGSYDAGHYRSVGSSPALRFDEANVHKQCVPCNQHLHGNTIPYRAELIRRRGIAEVERIEGPHDPKKYTVDELKAIRDLYRQKANELQSCA